MAAGFDHYIAKPVKVPHLLKMIEKMLEILLPANPRRAV